MRLNTFSKKYNIPYADLKNYLEKKVGPLETGPNTRLNSELLEDLKVHFKVDEQLKDQASSQQREELHESANDELEHVENLKESSIDQTDKDASDDHAKKTDVIRAPKIKLEGVKVVGKIDLPEPAPKAETDEEKNGKSKPSKSRRVKNQNAKSDKKSRKKSLSYEEKQKREERKRKQLLKQEHKKRKEQKRKHYLKVLEQRRKKQPSKKPEHSLSKSSKESIQPVESDQKTTQLHRRPSSPLRRFWGWLLGEYDN